MDTSTYGNGVITNHTYNADNTLAGITHSGSGSDIGDYSYTWDANKNKLSETITGVMSGYGFDSTGYDDEDRLTAWNRDDNNLDQSWNLSPVGDWNSITENGAVQSRSHGPTHELLAVDSQSVSHDVKGNMTLIPAALRPDGNALSLVWDRDNKMSSATTNGVTVTQRFDALGRRVACNNDIYVQTGQQTVADYVSGTAPTTPEYTYVYASYIDEPVMRAGVGALRYYHRGQQYSINALTDSSGNVTERYAYTAFGTPTITDGTGATLATSVDNNRYTYTGREWDEALSLYHYRARMYDSISGRFCTRDPIGFWDTLNVYAVKFGMSGSDPSGLLSIQPFGARPSCGGGQIQWRVDPGRFEEVIVQYVCITWNQVVCRKKAGCCKGAARDSCEFCFYELLRGYGDTKANPIDTWGSNYNPPFPNCGSRGTVSFKAEIRAFPSVAGDHKKIYDHKWLPGGKVTPPPPCGNRTVEINDYSLEAPGFWNNKHTSKSSCMRVRWKCCTGDGNWFQMRWGTTGKDPDVRSS